MVCVQAVTSQAANACLPVVGKLATVEGRVEIQRASDSAWQPAKLGSALCQGDLVRAGARSRATVLLINQAVLRIDQNTAMRLDNITPEVEERSVLSLLKGAFQSFSRKPRGFEVNTPYLNGSIEGTEFVFRVEEDQSILTVFEGTVVASNDQGSTSVSGGESVVAEKGLAPQARTVVRPRDAAQWSLYYPPVMTTPPDMSPQLQKAVQRADHGDTAGAFEALDHQVPVADRDAGYHLYRASLLLSVGRVDEARASIDKGLSQDPNAGLAYALRAVINVTQNDNTQALADANQAVSLSPDSAAAKIALSYAQQAEFQIPAARDTLLQAVQQQPEDALAWARLSELQLMLGDRESASESAGKAASLAPDLERAQITRGFAALAEFRNSEAKSAFKRAIELDSADPLPHLGLGLARISAGDLEQGGRDIEVAIGLDSNNALLRAYLGKTYFEEKRIPLDTEQFAIAKELDPHDPTAFLYDGIAKQTENRPVEAVEDLEKSIELNDNRAAFRSRLLLDKDRATRGTSLARAYRDLGFEQLGVNEATRSLELDPANASAHRFLSDSYGGARRHEIARVSELLQAQLMQDININPIQPSVSETNLNIVTIGGSATPGFDEFTPLFQRNQTQFDMTGFGGNNDTHGGEAVISALYGGVSLSAGAYTYNSDGWRNNNDLDQNIYNAFTQWAITPEINVQAEFRRRETDNGDLAFNFDPDDFSDNKKVTRNQSMGRLGLRYSPTPRSNFLVSYIYSDINEDQKESEDLDEFTTFSIDFDSHTDGYLAEGQYIFEGDWLNIIAGGAYSKPDTTIKESVLLADVDFGPIFQENAKIHEDVNQKRGYVYTNITPMESVALTVGASYDDYQEDPVDKTSLNPKFGVQWGVNDNLRLRATALKVLKPSLINNRTIEPTQVAGFNQLFDDPSGTKYWRYGVGADWRLRQNLAVGAEATWRDLDEPVLNISQSGKEDFDIENRDEQLHKLYLNWTPLTQVAVSAEFVYDRYKSDDGLSTEFGNRPEEVKTYSLPLTVAYFNPTGFFAAIGGTYVDQDVDRSDTAFQADGDDNFFLVDTSIGYRFPKRRGIVSLGVKNLFDKGFDYQDDSYREFSQAATTGPYFPDRIILGRFTLNF
jgi:tetratricopeptide (TPR) repeat protein